jgi:hypothetical protein
VAEHDLGSIESKRMDAQTNFARRWFMHSLAGDLENISRAKLRDPDNAVGWRICFHGDGFNCWSTNGEQFFSVTPRVLKLVSTATPSASTYATSVKSRFNLRPSLNINSQS